MLGSVLPLAFCGSKAGATFCLAVISIGSGLKPRASQRCRNNVFCRVKREMGPRQIFWLSSDPPTMLCPGAGGMASDLTA